MKYNIKLVKQWAIDRGLHESTLQAQFCKKVEEGGEIFEGVLLQDKELFVDAIGDELVVLTIMCMIEGIDPEEYIKQLTPQVKSNFDGFNDGVGQLVCYRTALTFGYRQGDLARAVCKGLPIAEHVRKIIIELNHLCDICCVDLRECYRIAFNVINKRKKGKTVNGVFIKDE